MKKFDFDSPVDRRHSGSYKWDTAEDDVLPMWVADMDFKTAPCVIEALQKRVEHGVFGYTQVGEDYYSAVCNWFERRHGWAIDSDHIIYTSGVVPAISAILQAVTQPGDRVICQTPAYNCFYSSIRNAGCQLAPNPLLLDRATGHFSIDYENLEELASDPRTTVMILCNPHNPTGRVWSLEELTEIARICHRHNVFVISDEIHCELTYPPLHYTPFGTLDKKYTQRAAICTSPSKSFNTAGLQIANIVASDDETRRRIDRAININEVCDVNPFGVVAAIAAYNEGGEWLDELKDYLHNNYLYLCDRFAKELPQLWIAPLEATYLAWVNVSATGLSGDQVADRLLADERLRINPGSMYGVEGHDYIRINLATQHSVLADAIDRMVRSLAKLM